jgi:hypothetical protein
MLVSRATIESFETLNSTTLPGAIAATRLSRILRNLDRLSWSCSRRAASESRELSTLVCNCTIEE